MRQGVSKGREEVRARVEKLGRKGRREGGREREEGEVRRGRCIQIMTLVEPTLARDTNSEVDSVHGNGYCVWVLHGIPTLSPELAGDRERGNMPSTVARG